VDRFLDFAASFEIWAGCENWVILLFGAEIWQEKEYI
jgi:hypothetical protein